MSSTQPTDPSSQQSLQNYCASQMIDLQFCQWPEIRFELVNGQFWVGGTLEGSRWLLQQALLGWGLEAAIAFAPVELWWEALRQAYNVPCQSQTDWLIWAESLPLVSLHREFQRLPLGSQYTAEHRWVRDHLSYGLSNAVSLAHLGYCAGPHYGMQLGSHMLTPDMLFLRAEQLAQDVFHDYYVEIPAHLVIEVVLPEQRAVDEQVRRALYEHAQVLHYWTVDPVERHFRFWEWTAEGYQAGSLDPDGCYRGVADLSFSPDIFWLGCEQDRFAERRKFPAFMCPVQPYSWRLAQELGTELSYGSVPFAPKVGLDPQPISVEQFVSWCPEAKIEGPPFPLINGESGTRQAIAMLLMSLGLVETVKLVAGYEWVRILRGIIRQQQNDAHQREEWWQWAREIAGQLQQVHGVGGVGVIGSLVDDLPLHQWSEIHLVIWDVPKTFNIWLFWETLPNDRPIQLTEALRARPGIWQEISERMQVLAGKWESFDPPPQRRMKFCWIEPGATA